MGPLSTSDENTASEADSSSSTTAESFNQQRLRHTSMPQARVSSSSGLGGKAFTFSLFFKLMCDLTRKIGFRPCTNQLPVRSLFFSSKHSIKAERFYELNLMWFDEKNKALKSTSGPLSSTSGALTNTYIRFCSSTPRTTDAQ